MDWKSDSEYHESEIEPYSSFQSSKSGKLIDRMELPIILIGAGLLALVILFVLFIPKKNEITIDDYKHLVSRLDQLEKKIEDLGGRDIDIREFDPSKNPVQYQQLINWIKSNAEVISETIKKVDEIEKKLNIVHKTGPVANDNTLAAKKVTQKQKPPATAKSSVKSRPAVESKSPEKAEPLPEKSQVKSEPQVAVKPEAAKPELSPPALPAEKKPVAEVKQIAKTKPADAVPETVKLIFHRVEKGETLYRISRNYGISVEKLQELNDMKKDDLLIHVGQELVVRKEKQ